MKNRIGKAVLFLASQGVTLFGSSLVQFAIVWYVTLNTKSGFLVSALTCCSYLPQFLISFAAGVWADRFPKKKMIIIADASIAAATLVLALIFPFLGEESGVMIAALLVTSVIRSLGAGIQTPAVNAVIPRLVPEDKLMKFNGINSAVQSVVQFAAPAAAGALLTFGTLRATLFIDIATAAVGIGILACIAIPELKSSEGSASTFGEIVKGFRYASENRFVGKLLILNGIFIFLCVPAGFLASLFVGKYYGDTYFDLTWVELVGFAGMALGGLIIGAWGGFKNRATTLALGMGVFGLLAVGMGAVKNFIFYLIMMGVYGIALTMEQTAVTTLLQEKSAPEMQGRVFGLFGAVYSGSLPIGMAVFGPLSDVMSMRVLMIASGVLLCIMAAVVVLDRKFYRNGLPSVEKTTEFQTK